MRKRGNILVCILEIFLLISMSFAISFVLSDNLISAQGEFVGPPLPPTEVELKGASSGSLTPVPAQSTALRFSGISGTGTSGIDVTIPVTNVEQGLQAFQTPGGAISGEITSPSIVNGKLTALVDGKPVTLTQQGTSELQAALNLKGITLQPAPSYSYKVPLLGTQINNFFLGNLVEGLIWSLFVVGAIQLIGSVAGLDRDLTNTLSIAAASGIIGGKALYGLFGTGQSGFLGGQGAIGGWLSPLGATGLGALIAFGIFVALYSKEKKKFISFQCLPFEPPIGGAKCEECNKDSFRPCSEYRCKSLGQACRLLNPGTNEERCAWVNPRDVKSPTIEPWADALKPSGLAYVPDNTIRPPNRGVKIVKGRDGCIQAFTPLEFGIILNEPAQCKIDYNPDKTFDQMGFYFGGSNYYRYNHTQRMKLPGPDTGGIIAGGLAPELKNDGFFSLFVQCRDANGNVNEDKFVFNFCVDPSPDTTPPVIEGTSIKSGGFVRYNAQNVPIELYVNEPAECKWSRGSKAYNDMENSMNCAIETFQINADLNYVCKANLTGIKNQQDNKFYFRCKDQPGKPESERNVNTQSYELILKGSQPLSILSVGPNGTIFGSTDTVTIDLTVRTDDGSEEGKAICYFSDTGLQDSYITMFETNSFDHKQSLDLVAGNYKYFFRCIDSGGNNAEATTEFSVVIDKSAPMVTRAYKEDGLKIVTEEDAECVYDLKSCNYVFEEGLPMIYSNPSIKMNHFAEWKANSVYYIKCRDLYGNQPGPNECNIVVNSVELVKEEI